MAALKINYLGEFAVFRDGESVALPPSKKTRALLAYLSLNPRRFRREALCELLWEIPDDPRGSLRWSLSKLRRLVDDDTRQRIVADRNHVEIDSSDVSIDVLNLRTVVGKGLTEVATDVLESAAKDYRGNFLEGLDLPNFHDYHAWCIAERDQVARAQAAVLRELVSRLSTEPERAVPHARALVAISPYDEDVRALLIRLLVMARHAEEAEQQFQLGLRMLKEAGIAPTGVMQSALRQIPAVASAPRRAAVQARPAEAVDVGQSSGLVGRDAEAAVLAGLLRQVAETRRAAFALVRGEPGIGKTRLVDAVSALASGTGALVLEASAYESGSIRPFSLWIDALQRHDAKSMDEVFSAVVSEHEGGNRDWLFESIGRFVAAAADERPLVLVFDDIHWCDDSSAAAIHYVARMNRERPVFGILAARDADLRDNVAAEQAIRGLRRDGLLTDLTLGPLDEQALQQLISERAPAARGAELSRQCGGNPLLAIELARAEQEGEKSTTVAEMVRERLNRFGVDGSEVLQWAAVLSPHFDVGTIANLTEFEPARIGGILDAAERQGMLTASSDGLTFSHDLLARAVYSTLSPVRREVMHRRVADLLEQSTALDLGRASDLAHHAAQSGDPGLAARAMVSAGRLCLRFYANDEALSLFRRGMQLVAALPEAERVAVSIDLHDIRLAAGPLDDWEASAREYVALAEQALDHGQLAQARLGYHMASYLRWAHGQWAYAREETLQSERAVRTGRDEDQIMAMAETAKCLVMIERDLSKADAMLMEAKARAGRKALSFNAIPAGLGLLCYHEGRFDEAEELFKDSRTLCKAEGDRLDEYMANENLMMIEYHRGHFDAAKRYCDELVSIGEKLRIGSEAPFARALYALCAYAMEDDDSNLDAALEELRIVDAKHRLAYTLNRAAQLDLKRERPDRARERATEALEYAALLQRASEMVWSRAILGMVCRANDDNDGVAEHLQAVTELQSAGVSAWASDYFRELHGPWME